MMVMTAIFLGEATSYQDTTEEEEEEEKEGLHLMS